MGWSIQRGYGPRGGSRGAAFTTTEIEGLDTQTAAVYGMVTSTSPSTFSTIPSQMTYPRLSAATEYVHTCILFLFHYQNLSSLKSIIHTLLPQADAFTSNRPPNSVSYFLVAVGTQAPTSRNYSHSPSSLVFHPPATPGDSTAALSTIADSKDWDRFQAMGFDVLDSADAIVSGLSALHPLLHPSDHPSGHPAPSSAPDPAPSSAPDPAPSTSPSASPSASPSTSPSSSSSALSDDSPPPIRSLIDKGKEEIDAIYSSSSSSSSINIEDVKLSPLNPTTTTPTTSTPVSCLEKINSLPTTPPYTDLWSMRALYSLGYEYHIESKAFVGMFAFRMLRLLKLLALYAAAFVENPSLPKPQLRPPSLDFAPPFLDLTKRSAVAVRASAVNLHPANSTFLTQHATHLMGVMERGVFDVFSDLDLIVTADLPESAGPDDEVVKTWVPLQPALFSFYFSSPSMLTATDRSHIAKTREALASTKAKDSHKVWTSSLLMGADQDPRFELDHNLFIVAPVRSAFAHITDDAQASQIVLPRSLALDPDVSLTYARIVAYSFPVLKPTGGVGSTLVATEAARLLEVRTPDAARNPPHNFTALSKGSYSSPNWMGLHRPLRDFGVGNDNDAWIRSFSLACADIHLVAGLSPDAPSIPCHRIYLALRSSSLATAITGDSDFVNTVYTSSGFTSLFQTRARPSSTRPSSYFERLNPRFGSRRFEDHYPCNAYSDVDFRSLADLEAQGWEIVRGDSGTGMATQITLPCTIETLTHYLDWVYAPQVMAAAKLDVSGILLVTSETMAEYAVAAAIMHDSWLYETVLAMIRRRAGFEARVATALLAWLESHPTFPPTKSFLSSLLSQSAPYQAFQALQEAVVSTTDRSSLLPVVSYEAARNVAGDALDRMRMAAAVVAYAFPPRAYCDHPELHTSVSSLCSINNS